ncbi:helix-turn-helix domain-containing protein [Alicyclobacillus acidoterrestris]|uniref:helix-turn-helix domain-containing protein n=1 Tax=Alicyclobacillus acidoterrestris TaxID=1450 RepID=UPI003F538248
MASFAERLRQLRLKNSLTQKQVADKLGITESAYGFYEQGKRDPSQSSLVILSDLFGVSTDWLLTGKEPSTAASSDEQEFTEWIKENMDDLFFYEFNKSPEEMKQEAIETFRTIWEIEKKKAERRKGKE